MSVGSTPGRYNLVRSIADPSMSYGELIVDFNSPEDLVKSMNEIQVYLTENYPQAYVRLKRYNLMFKKYPVEVMFQGPDPAVLHRLTEQAMDIMRKSDKNCLVTTDWEAKVPHLEVDYNQPASRSMGISRSDVGTSLLASAGGIPTAVFYDGNVSENIYIKSVGRDGKSIESLDNVPVFSMIPHVSEIDATVLKGLVTGAVNKEDVLSQMFATKPLSQATNGIRLKWEDPIVLRFGGERAMRAQSNPMPGYSADDARNDILKQIEAIELPEGYSMSWEGEYRASQESMKYLFKNFPLAIVLIIAILIMLFNCFRKPVIIMCCIPLIFVGVVPFMLVTGKTFGFVAIVGVLGLVGMIVKNGVILMDEITLQLNNGVEPVEALLSSSASRFRPVMMASLTTILGMIPLLTDDFFGSIAVTIMGGLFIGTIITLLFIPILYAVFFKIKVK
jgi:multidrug efflux pump subunit AcrB